MRLIDADHFLNFIKSEMKQDRPDDMHLSNIIRVLEDLPTVYDIDKVVEEMEKHRATFQCASCKHFYNGKKECREDCVDALIDNLIEIVRKVGVE